MRILVVLVFLLHSSLCAYELADAESKMVERMNWLWAKATVCDQNREYKLAEAYMLGLNAIDPSNGYVLGNLASYVGKQERYTEALEITNIALQSERRDDIQLNMMKVVWLAHLGREKESSALLGSIKEPDYNSQAKYEMYQIGLAFYHARISKDKNQLNESVDKALSRNTKHWEIIFMNDVSFDGYDKTTWIQNKDE